MNTMNDDTLETCELPSGIKTFINSMNKKHGCSNMQAHNMYLLQTTDMNGNVTGEAYAMNLMTDYGFKRIYKDNYGDNRYMFIGNSSEMPSLTANTIISPIVTTASTTTNEDYARTSISYDSSTGIITGATRVYIGYFNYNLSNITEAVEITEVGYGSAYNALYTHARVYDADGNLSSITKNINERLTITMYWSMSYNKSIIQEAYDNGVYMFIDPSWFVRNSSGSSRSLYFQMAAEGVDNHTTQPYYNNYKYLKGSYQVFYTNATLTDSNTLVSSITPEAFLFEGKYDYMSYFIYGDYHSYGSYSGFCSSRFFIITNEKLPEPEELESDIIYTNSYNSPYLTFTFGKNRNSVGENAYGNIPASQFDIKSLCMYNHLTKEWDIEESYDNDPNTDYTARLMRIAGNMAFDINGVQTSVRVFINTNPDIPITGFTNTGITIYATDEYWDIDTWEQITSLTSVPTELQKKRYWIKVTGTDQNLTPTRDMVLHKINPIKEQYTITGFTENTNYLEHLTPLSSDTNGWILSSYNLLYPQDDGSFTSYPMKSPGEYKIHLKYRWATDDRIIVMTFPYDKQNIDYIGKNIRVYNVGNDPTIAPTYTDMILDFSGTLTHQNFYSFCDSGYFVAQSIGNIHEAVIVDLYGSGDGTPTQYRLDNVDICFALNRSDNCVYRYPSTNNFEIYNMRERTVIDSFTIPEEYEFQGIGGWKDFIYVRVVNSGTYSTFLYNMNTKTLVNLSNVDLPVYVINTTSYSAVPNRVDLSVDDCWIIGGRDSLYTKLISANDPEHPIDLCGDLPTNNEVYSTPRQNLCNAQLKYINDGKQLVLTTNYYRTHVVDIGHILDHGPLTFYPTTNYRQYERNGWYYMRASGFIDNGLWLLDDYGKISWYPIEQLIPHKMIGSTKTIQSYNNPKRLQNKKYTITVTNDTSRWE